MPIILPAQRDNRPAEYQLLMQGLQQLGGGLAAIGQAKKGLANQQFMARLAQEMQGGGSGMDAIASQPQAGKGGFGGFLDKFNPFTPSQGISPAQTGLQGHMANYATDYQGRTGGGGKDEEDDIKFKKAKKYEGYVSQLTKYRDSMVDEITGEPLPGKEAAVAKIDQRIAQFEDQIPGLTGTELSDEERFESEIQGLGQEQQGQSYQPVEVAPRTEYLAQQKGFIDHVQQKKTIARIGEMSDVMVRTALKNILPNLPEEEQMALQRGLSENNPEKLRNALKGLVAP